VDQAQGVVAEHGVGAAGQAQVVGDVAAGLLSGHAGHRVVDGLDRPGRFVLRAGLHSRPSRAQRLAAVAVAHWAVEVPALH